jgi:hypothetical protein
MKTIFLNSDRSHEVKQQSGAHASPTMTTIRPACYARRPSRPGTDEQIMVTAEQPHRPWLTQGVGNAL